MDASGWPVVATHLATHFTRWETNDGNGWRRLDIQKRRWNLARRDRHRARQGHRAQEAAHGPRQDQGGGEREAQDEAGRIRAQGLHAELAVAAPHGLARDKELHGLSFGNLMAVTGGNNSVSVDGNEFARPQLKLHVNKRMTN